MLEQSKLPAKQRKFAQKQQQNSESTAYGGLRTDIRSNFGFNQDEHYYTVQRISQQSLSYGTAVSRLSDNADAAPIQMLTLSDKGTTINLDNLEQFINHINVQKLKAGTPLDKFYTKMIQFNNLVDFNKILITNVQYDRNTTLKEIEGLVKEYLSKNPWEAIKQLAESESWKGLFSSGVSGETFMGGILRVFTDEDVNKFVKDLIEKNLEGYLQFGKALRYHSEMERPNFHADKPDDNINPGDIKDDYDKTRACAIVE